MCLALTPSEFCLPATGIHPLEFSRKREGVYSLRAYPASGEATRFQAQFPALQRRRPWPQEGSRTSRARIGVRSAGTTIYGSTWSRRHDSRSAGWSLENTAGPAVAGPGRSLLRYGLLLPGNRALGALTGSRIGLGSLAAHRQTAPVAQTAIATDIHEPLDVRGDFTP